MSLPGLGRAQRMPSVLRGGFKVLIQAFDVSAYVCQLFFDLIISPGNMSTGIVDESLALCT